MDIQQYLESGVLEEYALGVLPAAEAAEVERQAATYPQIRAELNSITRGLDTYAVAHSLTPPPAMRERVLAGWQQAIRAEAPVATPAMRVAPAAASAPVNEPVVRSINSAPAAETSGIGWGWLVAASVALLLSLGGNYFLYNRWQGSQQELLAVQNEQAQFAATQQASLKKQSEELAVLRDVELQSVVLAGTPAAPNATARVLYNPKTKAVYLDVRSLPAVPDGKQYQLWALDNGQPVDAGVLAAATAAGDSLQQMKDIASAQAFAMTVENAGGSPTPTLSTMTVLGKI